MHSTARELVRPRRLTRTLHPLVTAVALVVASAALALPSTAARAAGRHVPRAFFGIHDASQQAYGRLSFGSVRLWDTGTTWQDLETAPGTYDWSRLDDHVARAQAHHVKVLLVLGMTPSFYADSPTVAPGDLDAFRSYVRAVMERYRSFDGGRGIESYQVWNEGNVSSFWSDSPHHLAELTRIVARARQQIDPGARVVAPSFAVRLPSQRRWISAFQRQHLDGHPVWRFYDVNALSLYPRERYGDRVGGPEQAMAQLPGVRARLARAGVPRGTPLWASELNYGLKAGSPGTVGATPISERRQVANVLRTYLLGAARGLGRIYWFRYDMPTHTGGWTVGNTLLSTPADPSRITPAGRALRLARSWLSGRLVAAPGHSRACSRDRRGTYSCTVRTGSRSRTIVWNPYRQVRLRVPSSGRRSGKHTYARVGYRPVVVPVAR